MDASIGSDRSPGIWLRRLPVEASRGLDGERACGSRVSTRSPGARHLIRDRGPSGRAPIRVLVEGLRWLAAGRLATCHARPVSLPMLRTQSSGNDRNISQTGLILFQKTDYCRLGVTPARPCFDTAILSGSRGLSIGHRGAAGHPNRSLRSGSRGPEGVSTVERRSTGRKPISDGSLPIPFARPSTRNRPSPPGSIRR